MPLYEFKCNTCSTEKKALTSPVISTIQCLNCGDKMQKQPLLIEEVKKQEAE